MKAADAYETVPTQKGPSPFYLAMKIQHIAHRFTSLRYNQANSLSFLSTHRHACVT